VELEPTRRSAFYALAPGGWRDWWTVLHLPYTAWHLSYVAVGAALAPDLDGGRLLATLLAFFCAVGIGAHALDELHGRPLGTTIPGPVLVTVGVAGVAAAAALGVLGLWWVGLVLAPFVMVGVIVVFAYNLELWSGRLHNDVVFAGAWGAFPLLTSYVAQDGRLSVAALLGAAAAYGISAAQRSLSTPTRLIRRRATAVRGSMALDDGSERPLDRIVLLTPLERALRAMSWAMVALAAAMVTARLAQ
jgi:hypothetical protein